MKRLILAAAVAGLSSSCAMAQSFDCSGRLAVDEQAICDSRALSRLDVELSDVYEDVLAKAPEHDRVRIRDEQRDWIGTRSACRERGSCLSRLYRDRISELEDKNERYGRSAAPGEAYDGRDRWAALGSVDVGDDSEPLTILVGFSRGRFDALQLRVRDSGARIRRLTVVYANGMSQSYRFRRPFRAGQLSDLIELRARRFGRFIERIVVEARGAGATRIDVIGRRSGNGFNDRQYSRDDDGGRDGRGGYTERDRYPDQYRTERDRYSDQDRTERDRYPDQDSADRDRYSDRDRNDRDGDDDRRRYSDLQRDTERDPGRFEGRDFEDRGADTDRDREVDRDEPRDWREGDRRDDYVDDRRADVSRERLLDFVKDVFHRTAEMSERELRETYASRADYYGERRKPIDDIIADKRNYAERWNDRAFRVRDDTFRFEETAEPGVYELTYAYDFHVRGDGRESKGNGETTLLVDTNGERYVILKEDGKVLQKF